MQENRLCSGARIIHDQDQEDPDQRPGPGRWDEKLDSLLSAQIKFQGQYQLCCNDPILALAADLNLEGDKRCFLWISIKKQHQIDVIP